MHYASPKHERLYRNVARGKGYPANTMAAIYLITAKPELWKNFRKAINSNGIEWAASLGNTDTGWDGYYLECAAQSIAKATAHQVTLHDLIDRKEYSQELLRLIVTALWIARNNQKTTRRTTTQKGRARIC